MALPLDERPYARLVRKIAPDATFRRAWTLRGGVSAQVTAFEIAHADGQTQKLIARQHGAADLARNPNIAADEFRLLQLLRAAGLPAAAPEYLDQSGEIFATPVVVVGYIEGEPLLRLDDAPTLVPQLAAQLARIHHVDCSLDDLSFLPTQNDLWAAKCATRPAQLDNSLDEGRIRDTLENAWPLAQINPSCLLHGDYWPGNVLWRDGHIVGVIDWEDAATGDPLADLANSRLEVLWAFGSDAMHRFTHEYARHYAAAAPLDLTNLPYWDLCAALRLLPVIAAMTSDPEDEGRLRAWHREFTAWAFARLR
ncbi:MAG TPA: phosphotransferase [Ktedonobacterales bacterium]|nr:phosphotransferase [Ktedonobacterales bacterium]